MSLISLHRFAKVVSPLNNVSTFTLHMDTTVITHCIDQNHFELDEWLSKVASGQVSEEGFVQKVRQMGNDPKNEKAESKVFDRFIEVLNTKYKFDNKRTLPKVAGAEIADDYYDALYGKRISIPEKTTRFIEVNLNKFLKSFESVERARLDLQHGVKDSAKDATPGYNSDLAAVHKVIKSIKEAFKEYSYPRSLVQASAVRAAFTNEMGVVDLEKLKETSLQLGKNYEQPAMAALIKLVENYNSEAAVENHMPKPVFSALVKEVVDKKMNPHIWPNSQYQEHKSHLKNMREIFTEKALNAFTLGSEQEKTANVVGR